MNASVKGRYYTLAPALAISHLTKGTVNGSQSTGTTASVSPTTSGAVLLYITGRSTDLASMSGENFQAVGNGLTWTKQTIGSPGTGLFDGSNRMLAQVLLGTGTPSSGTIVISCVPLVAGNF